MPSQRPRSVLILGVLHLLIGGLGLLCGLGGAGVLAVGGERKVAEWFKAQLPADQQDDFEFSVRFDEGVEGVLPWYKAFSTGVMVIGLLTSVVLLVAGVGLLRMAGWGRSASFLYVILSLSIQTAGLVTDAFAVIPAKNQWLDAELQRDADQKDRVDGSRPNMAEEIGGDLVFMIYPLVVLFVMLRPSVTAAFRGGSPEPDAGDAPGDGYGPSRF